MHHSPFDHEFFTRLDDDDDFMKAVTGKVRLVLVGHEHKKRYKRYPDSPDRNKPETGREPDTEFFSAPALMNSDGEPIIVHANDCPLLKVTPVKKEVEVPADTPTPTTSTR